MINKIDKIFNKEIEEYLVSLGMNIEDINKLRNKKVKEYAISILHKVIEAIESNDLDSIQEYLSYSPSGDDMGCDNTFIDFGGVAGSSMDIKDLFQYLS
jgi:hypothetical protein